MDRSLLDTDILSEILKGKNSTVEQAAKSYCAQHMRLSISTVSILEIVKGFKKANKLDALNQFLQRLPTLEILAFDLDAATVAGKIYGDLERKGLPIGRADPMIAGIAISREMTLITGNMKHFARIQALGYDLRLEDWRHTQ